MANYSFNKIIIIGRLGQDPVFKAEKARFKLYHNVIKYGKEDVEWYNIKTFGKLARLAMEHLHKGDLVCVEGRLDLGERTEEIIAERMTFISSKKRETKPESAECVRA